MKEFIDHISSYNLFNYLLPGVIFSVIIEKFTTFNFLPDNIILVAFVCYFIGMIISRIGSILLEPLLKKINFIKFKNYVEYVEASKKDSKLDILSEQNNTYRSIITMLIVICFAKMYEWGISLYPNYEGISFYVFLILLLAIFLSAYRKQTSYISKRIDKNLNKYK